MGVDMSREQLDRLAITTIRTLAMDAVQTARSGHPGTAMAMAPVVSCLWQRFLRFDPNDPIWPNRVPLLFPGYRPRVIYPTFAQRVQRDRKSPVPALLSSPEGASGALNVRIPVDQQGRPIGWKRPFPWVR